MNKPDPPPEGPHGGDLERDVADAIRSDERVSSDRVDVSVDARRVVLRGAVQSHQRKLAAREIAEQATSDRVVDDRVRVEPPAPCDDREIVAAVRSTLRAHADVPHETIDVRARNGRVRLGGVVASTPEREVAEDVALAVPGVRAVRNLLLVDAQGQPRDAERCRRLERLLKHELGDAVGSVDAVVTGHGVTLTGEVASGWYARRAGELAMLDGAIRVRNRLRVREAT